MAQQTKTKEKSVHVVLIGLPKTGKTALASQFCNREVPTEYIPTAQNTAMDTTLQVGKNTYRFIFDDCSGDYLLNSRTTANSILSKGKIHIFVISPTESDSAEYIQGFFKETGKESDPIYRFVYSTHADCPDEDGIVQACKEFIPDDCKLFEYDVFKQKDQIISNFTDFVKRAVVEHPELFEGCSATGEKKKKAETKEEPKEKKGEKEKKGDGEKKGKCQIL
ncbi:hypothetical protein EIN_429850 [Entamoeba invadens IP1]|uniref:Uncharacterized protein n=1 Tax=Entamoeba invadens IP1 TaxID=370355 RepID=A0A0A1UGW0_ENTIV|nr:hypothetical protein EIN_429850 [Entamoeba invadens IP1]ELP95209.1 hypothetical protein EIN_429850 [Entamoeba invadens IP1]|eukprot:XP_004261980.1 hypothetical protein EIN_429850 [Entamoeba invadens IP1]